MSEIPAVAVVNEDVDGTVTITALTMSIIGGIEVYGKGLIWQNASCSLRRKKLDVNTKETVETKARRPPTRAAKTKANELKTQITIVPYVEEQNYVDRTKFHELHQRIITLQVHVLQLEADVAGLKAS
ncbi:hypothetical protein M9H77_08894 [Catharanthus roseus]|uniref:Uncharacterized protein n=1 Tax=Catharanthus roseus TaxID=4058 RepID=A0ACC0BZ22_CATRO|nr:hypothetical protein M9H77_08894 [Catharanthus roseus]